MNLGLNWHTLVFGQWCEYSLGLSYNQHMLSLGAYERAAKRKCLLG